MAFQVEGKLHKIFAIERKTETFSAREFILQISESQYPQLIKFQLTQDKCELVDNFQEGDDLIVHFDLRGREWNEKYFTNLNAWRLEAGGGAQASGSAQVGSQDSSQSSNQGSGQSQSDSTGSKTSDTDFDDDIPF